MAANVLFKKLTRAQYDALSPAPVAGTFYRVVEADTTESFYIGADRLDLKGLDVTEFALATASEGVVTIKGIKETDGKIAVGTTSANDITLAKVATTGASADVTYTNTTSGLTAATVQAAIDELASQSSGGVASKTVWFTDDSAGQSDYAKVYKLWQGANSPDAQVNPATLIGTINVPKDKVLQDSSIVDITYADGHLYDGLTDVTVLIKGESAATSADAGKYLKMEMQNVTDPLYVNLQVFVDAYTVAGSASEIQLALNDHEFSASVVSIDGSKIVYKTETSAGVGDGETVKQALTRLDGSDSTTGSVAKKAKDAATAAVSALDADVANYTPGEGGADDSGVQADGLKVRITEVDGVLTGVTASIVSGTYDLAGSAASAESAAKTYADGLLTWEEVPVSSGD